MVAPVAARCARLRADASAAFSAALEAVDPRRCVARVTHSLPAASPRGETLVIATGKAAAPMLLGLGDAPVGAGGFGLLPDGAGAEGVAELGYEVLRGGHPVPTLEGLAASRRLMAAASRLGSDDRLLYLCSGGSSALFEVPRSGIAAGDVVDTYRELLVCGAPIEEVNTVRRALSVSKGGGLALAAAPAAVTTLAISDVIGDPPLAIGSGPTICSPRPVATARAIVAAYGLSARLPSSVLAALQEDAVDRPPPAVLADEPDYRIVASNGAAVEAAAALLQGLGYALARRALPALEGDAGRFAYALATAVDEVLVGSTAPCAIVVGGETTVSVPASAAGGRGGRNQHAAAVLACALDGRSGFACLFGGTDGVDGRSDAAGALIDGLSARRAREAGRELDCAIAAFDTAPALAIAGDSIVTGPTGTNVGDIVIVLIDPRG